MENINNLKYLVIKGTAGLGNRLYTLSSAISYAKKTNRAIIIDWSDGVYSSDGRNVFNDYFFLEGINHFKDINDIQNRDKLTIYPPNYIDLNMDIEEGYSGNLSRIFERTPLNRIKYIGIHKLKGYWAHKSKLPKNKLLKEIYSWTSIFNSKEFPFGHFLPTDLKEDIVIFSDYLPPLEGQELIEHLQLKENVNSIINEFFLKHDFVKDTIGIHIRATDKNFSSSLTDAFEKIDYVLEKENIKKIFLATDNPEVIEVFKKKYKNLILYPKYIPSAYQHGIHLSADVNIMEKIYKESIIEMFLLAKCEYLFYQSNSTFSLISKLFHTDHTKSSSWN